jgi:hypothetical protein
MPAVHAGGKGERTIMTPMPSRRGPAWQPALRLALLGLLALLLAPIAAARAENPVPAPQADYTATEIVEVLDRKRQSRLETRVYRSGRLERRIISAQGQKVTMIVRPDRQVAYMLMPGGGMAMRMPFEQAGRDLSADDLQALEAEAVGQETVAGLPTTKYRISGRSDRGYGFDGHAWVTDDGIRVRLEGAVTGPEREPLNVRIHLEDVARGPQSADLFDLPPDAQVVDIPKMPGGGGPLGMPGG